MCIAGIVTSSIGLVVCILWTVSYASLTSEILNAPAESQAIDQSASNANGESAIRLGFGETHTWSGGEEITVAAPVATSESAPFTEPPEGRRHVSLDVTITNKGDVDYNVVQTTLTAQHNGRAAPENPILGDTLPTVQLPPGDSTTFTIVYEINATPGDLQVSVQPSLFATNTVYFSGKI